MQQTKRWLQETKTWLKQTKSLLQQLTSWLQKKVDYNKQKMIASNETKTKINVVDWQLCCGQKVLEAIRGRQIIMTLIPGNQGHQIKFVYVYSMLW